MVRSSLTRLLAVAAVLTATACAPVLSGTSYVAMHPVHFATSDATLAQR